MSATQPEPIAGFQHIREEDVPLVNEYVLFMRRKDLRERSIQSSVGYISRLAFACPGVRLCDVTPEQIEAALNAPRGRSGNGLTARSRKAYLNNVRGFYKWAFAKGLIETNPADLVPLPITRAAQPRPVSESDFSALVAMAPTPTLRLWILLAGACGLRCMEIAGLTWDHVDIDEALLHVVGKGARIRDIPMTDQVVNAFESHRVFSLDGAVNVFEELATGTAYKPAQISRILNAWIQSQDSIPHYTVHQLRHRFATELLDVSEDHRLVQSLLGHSSISTLSVYAHVRSGRKRTAIENMRAA